MEKMTDKFCSVAAKEGPPAILQALSDTVATCGRALTLQCQIKGSPAPMILWRKDGKMIGNTKDFKQTYQNNIALLAIQEIMEQDGGCYECVARNSFGAVSSSFSITVHKGEIFGIANTMYSVLSMQS